MKRLIPPVLILFPAVLFAQTQSRDVGALKRLGLDDARIAQVLEIRQRTESTIAQDAAQIRLLRAQIQKALLPATVDIQAVNGMIDQAAQARADAQKTLVSSHVRLRQIMGDETYKAYLRQERRSHWPGFLRGRALYHRWPFRGWWGGRARGSPTDGSFD